MKVGLERYNEDGVHRVRPKSNSVEAIETGVCNSGEEGHRMGGGGGGAVQKKKISVKCRGIGVKMKLSMLETPTRGQRKDQARDGTEEKQDKNPKRRRGSRGVSKRKEDGDRLTGRKQEGIQNRSKGS